MEINTQFRVVLISLIQSISRVFAGHLFPYILGTVATELVKAVLFSDDEIISAECAPASWPCFGKEVGSGVSWGPFQPGGSCDPVL